MSLFLDFSAAVNPLLEQLMQAGGRKAAQSAGQDNVGRDHSPLVYPQRHDHADDHHHGGNDPIADLGQQVLDCLADDQAKANDGGIDPSVQHIDVSQNFHMYFLLSVY